MDAMATSNEDLDIPDDIAATLIDPAAYADARIHDAYRWLRANNRLGVARPDGYAPFWVVTKNAHVAAISRQRAVPQRRPANRAVDDRVRGARAPDHRRTNLVRSLVQMDAPDHPKLFPL